MKIAVFHELPKGGARRVTYEMAAMLMKSNIVDLYTTSDFFDKEERKSFSECHIFPFNRVVWSGKDWKKRIYIDSVQLYKVSRLHKKIARDIDKQKYDLVLTFSSFYTHSPMILRYLRTKSVYYCHEPLRAVYDPSIPFPESSLIKGLYETLSRSIRKQIDKNNFSFCSAVLTSSQFTRKNIKAAYGRESTVVSPGINEGFFDNKRIKKDIDLLFLGSFDRIDGYDLWKKVEKKMQSSFKLLAVNSKQFSVSDEEVRRYYQRSKLVVCLTRNEPFGLIPLEAMACGTPVVALNQGGYKETIISGKTGLLLDIKNDSFVNKISLLLTRKKDLKRQGIEARKYIVSCWSWVKRIEKIEKELHRISDF